MNTIGRALIQSAIAFLTIAGVSAQTPSFEVASVKIATDVQPTDRLNDSYLQDHNFHGGPGTNSPDRIDYSRVTLRMLLEHAYAVRPEQIVGPGWITEQRYVIEAKLPPGTTPDQLRLMLQRLLAERFHVRLHRENKTLPVYQLVVVKGGPKLTPAESLTEYKDAREQAAAMKQKARAGLAANAGTGMMVSNCSESR